MLAKATESGAGETGDDQEYLEEPIDPRAELEAAREKELEGLLGPADDEDEDEREIQAGDVELAQG